MRSEEGLHSLDVAIDYSITNTAFAIGKDGKAFMKVHAFPYKADDHYVVYELTPNGDEYTTSEDTICDRQGLMKWLVDHNYAKSLVGAYGFLNIMIWRAHYHYSVMRA